MENITVSYDDGPLAQVEIEGVDYRVDPGLGPAVAVSRRAAGTWSWTVVVEGRWDGVRFRAKGLDYPVVDALGKALAQKMRDDAELYA